jgi:hypothetical protein
VPLVSERCRHAPERTGLVTRCPVCYVSAMRTLLAAALAVTSLSGAVARADVPHGTGFTCDYLVYDEDASTARAEVDAGPVAVADLPTADSADPQPLTWDATGNPATATVTCAVQVGGTAHYTDPDAVAVSASGIGVVELPPTLVSIPTTFTETLYLCTTWTLTDAHGDTATYYVDGATGDLSTDPATALCAAAVSAA